MARALPVPAPLGPALVGFAAGLLFGFCARRCLALLFHGALDCSLLRQFNCSERGVSDGANLGTFGTGTGPSGLAFDGTNIWIANSNSNNVTKLRATDGANLGTFGTGANPLAVAFDGSSIYTANLNGGDRKSVV